MLVHCCSETSYSTSDKDSKTYSSLVLCFLILLCKCIHFFVTGMFIQALSCCNHETGLIYLLTGICFPPPLAVNKNRRKWSQANCSLLAPYVCGLPPCVSVFSRWQNATGLLKSILALTLAAVFLLYSYLWLLSVTNSMLIA